MANEHIGVDVEISAEAKFQQAHDGLEKLSEGMASLGKQMSALGRAGVSLTKNLAGVGGDSGKIRQAASATGALASQTERLASARARAAAPGSAPNQPGNAGMSSGIDKYYRNQQFSKQLGSSVDNRAWIAAAAAAKATADAARIGKVQGAEWTAEVRRLEAAYGKAGAQARIAAAMGNQTPSGAGSAKAVAGRFQANPAIANQMLTHSLEDMNGALDKNVEKFDRLTNTRYALMGASFALTTTMVAGTAALVYLGKSFMELESTMARVQRTSGLTGQALGAIQHQLIDMAQTIPAAFSDIDKIATMAGQLNVAGEDIGSFTRTTLMFATATNATAEASAEAFGRLDELIPSVQGNFEALGSSILNVGINSVATETDIINTANNIAAVGASAGFTAEEVIGYAAAMSSLNIKPELARGGLTRIFGQINNVIAAGGLQLDQFAALSGRTADQFATDWRDSAAQVFQDILVGLNDMTEAGEAANVVLGQVGITNSRDVDVMARLAQNTDFLAESLGYAAEGFRNSGMLADVAQVQFDTLEARVQLMANSFQMLFAEIGSGAAGPFGFLIDSITGILIAWQKLNDNPIAHTVMGVVSGFVVLGTVLAGALAAFTALTSAIIASGTAWGHLRKAVVEHTLERLKSVSATNSETAALVSNAQASLTNAQSKRQMVGALLSANQALGGHSSRLGAVVSMLGGKWMLALGGAVLAVGALTTAIQDSQASLQEWELALDGTSAALGAFNAAAEGIDFGRLFSDFDFRAQKSQIGELIDEIQRAEQIGATFDTMGNLIPVTLSHDAHQFNDAIMEIAANLAKMSPESATRFMVDLGNQANLSVTQIANLIDQNDELRDSLIAAADAAQYTGFGADGLASSAELARYVMGEMRAVAEDAAGGLTTLEEAELSAADAASYFGDTVAQNFHLPTVIGDASTAMFDMAQGLAEGGMAFDYLSQAGIANTQNLMGAVAASMTAGRAMGISSTDSVLAVFIALQNAGIDTARLLQQLAAMGVSVIGGLQLASIQSGMAAAGPRVQNFAAALSRVAGAGLSAGRALGNRGGGAGRGARDAGKAAGAAAKKVRTLADYANDLAEVMGRAFEIRFGGGQAQDKITQGWLDIAEATAEAQEEIRDANTAIAETQATLAGLTADRAIKEYFLSIAQAYDDSLRAGKLGAELAELDAKMASERDDLTDSQKDAAEAQAKLDKSLTGNTGSAIENRETILDMVDSYQDYLKALASSGMSQGELQSKAVQLRREFVAQARQAGFSEREIQMYAASFDDMGTAINRVPRDITVTANTNPALQALAEFEAKATDAARSAGSGIGGALGGGIGGGLAGALGGLPNLLDDLLDDLLNPDTPKSQPKWLQKPDINTGSQIVQPGEVQVWDPVQHFDATGTIKWAKQTGDTWWTGFLDTLFPQFNNLGERVYRSGGGGGFQTSGSSSGNTFGTGFINGLAPAAILRLLTGSFGEPAPWNRTGSDSGGSYGLGLAGGFNRVNPNALTLRTFKAQPWGTKGGSLGGSLGTGTKSGFTGKIGSTTLLSHISGGNWSRAGGNSGGWYADGVKSGYASKTPGSSLLQALLNPKWYDNGYKIGQNVARGMKVGFNSNVSKVVAGAGVSAVKMYKQGGYTGDVDKNKIAGMVHGKEYVMPASATANIGRPALDYMRKHGAMPPAGGGGVSLANGITVIAELSATDRALIAQGNNVVLQVDGRAIASTTNSHNVGALNRGSN